MDKFIYFLRPVGKDGPVKIGCSVEPKSRLRIYLPWSPEILEIAATLPGDHSLEFRFHARFIESHIHHEWFRASGELSDTIVAIQRGTFDPETLPRPKKVPTKLKRTPWRADTKLAVSINSRIRHLEKRGVVVPPEIVAAAFRCVCGRYSTRDPRDAEIALAYLADYPRAAERRRAA